MASSLSAIWLLIPDKDNHCYHYHYSNLAALSSEEIFEGAPSHRVLSVPPVVTQRSIRMLMRVMMRVMIRVMIRVIRVMIRVMVRGISKC